MADQKAAYAKRAKILARKRQLRERFLERAGLRLTTAQKLMLPFKFIAFMIWYPIWIWLPDDDEPSDDRRRRGARGRRT